MSRSVEALLGLALALAPLPAPAQAGEWYTWNSPASGWIGTNPRNRDGLLYEDQDGVTMAVIWEADNAGPEALKGCDFAQGTRGQACPVDLIVDVLLQDGTPILFVRRLVALGRPGQQADFE